MYNDNYLYFLGYSNVFESFEYSEEMTLVYCTIFLPGSLDDERPTVVPDYFMQDNEANIYVTVRYYSHGTPCKTDRIICYLGRSDEVIYVDCLYGYSYDIINWLENYGDIELSVPLTDGSSYRLYVPQRS